jgi:opacity protein-like surface antigen
MKKLISLLAAVAVCALALSALSGAAIKTTTWTAALSSGQEIPKQVVKDANAHGLFKATLSGTTLKWKLTYAHLSGAAMQAHIHLGKAGVSGNVIVPLCAGNCRSGLTGTAKITSKLVAQMEAGKTYVNVHTEKNPAGEIRGQGKVPG